MKYDNEDTESEESCTEDHQNYQSNYKEEDNRFYFMENAALFGVKCNTCQKKIVCDPDKDGIVPNISAPVYVCNGRIKHKCKCCVCHSCYLSKIVCQTSGPRRRRNKL